MRVALGTLATVFLCLYPATTALATQAVTLGASFTPYRLGASTTIDLDLQIQAPAGRIPSALTEVEVRYPQNLGFALSGLGLAVCSASSIEAAGASGCPANSIMGRGDAVAELRFGSELVTENASLSIARAPDEEGHIALLLYASGPSPVNTQILSPAQLLPSGPPFGGRLNMQLPIIQRPRGSRRRDRLAARDPWTTGAHLLRTGGRQHARLHAQGHPPAQHMPTRRVPVRGHLLVPGRLAAARPHDSAVCGPAPPPALTSLSSCLSSRLVDERRLSGSSSSVSEPI